MHTAGALALHSLRAQFHLKTALEIGGPSRIFADGGLLPVYAILKSVDNCLFSTRTIWNNDAEAGRNFGYHPEKSPGMQFICEATNLAEIADATYDVILSSHCLEHIANPIKALYEWRRVLAEGGRLLLIVPNKDRTFDWRRPVTTLAHVIQDYERNIGEDDLTHLTEILSLHDLDKDPPAGSPDQFRRRCLENIRNRAMHHHVFDTRTIHRLMRYTGFRIISIEAHPPFHIVALTINSGARSRTSNRRKQP